MEQQLDEQGLYGIYDTWHIPWWQTKTFYITVIISGLLLAFIMLFFIVRFLRRKKMVPQPAWVRATEHLELLLKQANPENSKMIYLTISQIVRNYLNERYGLDTHGKTDKQLLVYLQNTEFPQHLLTMMETVFEGGVIIKFANARAAEEQMKQDLASCISIIKHTIPEHNKHN